MRVNQKTVMGMTVGLLATLSGAIVATPAFAWGNSFSVQVSARQDNRLAAAEVKPNASTLAAEELTEEVPSKAAPESSKIEGSVPPKMEGTAPPTAAPEASASAASDAATTPPDRKEIKLTLGDLVKQTLHINNVIRSKRTEKDIAASSVDREGAIFQPIASASISSARNKVKNTPEEELLRSGLGIYERRGEDYSAGVSMLLETGAKLETKVTMAHFLTNVTQQRRGSSEHDYQSFYGASITQPLLRDAGKSVTRTKIRVAELDASAAEDASKETDFSVTSEAIAAYFDLILAQERVRMLEEGVKMTDDLLTEANSLYRSGRIPQSGIWDVESSLLRYQAGTSDARQGLIEQMNTLRNLLLTSTSDDPTPLHAIEPLPEVQMPAVSFQDSMKVAMEKRPDYRMRKTLVEREGIQIAYAKNQALPKVDAFASYGINGLDLNMNDAMTDYSENLDYPSWTVGLQASMPLGTNQQAKADLRAANLRKQDALLNMKALETTLANDIDNSLSAIKNSYERWEMFRKIMDVEQKQVKTERNRLAAGRSDMREVLKREEVLINARNAVLEQAVAFAKAQVALEVAQGTLFEKYN